MTTHPDILPRGGASENAEPVDTGKLRYGIPDIRLRRVNGGEINPSTFAGHELVVFFCPADAPAAAKEIEDYGARAEAFVGAGAWLVGILCAGCPAEQAIRLPEGIHVTLAQDPEGAGWAAFESLLDSGGRTEESAGGTFLFVRGGCLAKAWPGSGHAEDALNELHRRA